jgi:hypothetical protein
VFRYDQRLHWWDVDPRTHPFDLDSAAERIDQFLQGHRRVDRDELVRRLDRMLVVECGIWAVFRSPSHVVLRRDGTVNPTSGPRVMETLAYWRKFFEQLAEVFEGLRDEDAALELAASRLLPIVVTHTYVDDAWYGIFARVLGWYLESAGHDFAQIQPAIDEVISGRFESWAAPTDETAHEAFVAVDFELGRIESREEPVVDTLERWRAVRRSAFGMFVAPGDLEPVAADGHERYIARIERLRDPERADRMASALVLCRDSATRGMQLMVDQLAEWQAIVLGQRAELRTGVAFAKRGRERYGISPDLRADFERALADAADPATPIAVRAARVYLDVCFFHPFDDGNARAARLALDHVLTSAGLALHSAEPLFVLSRLADDSTGSAAFATMVGRMIGISRAPRSA